MNQLKTLFILIVSLVTSSQLLAQYNLSTHSTIRNNDITLFNLSKNGSSYGQAIWMNRSASSKRIKAKYFASGNAYQAYLNWKKGKDIILVSSGAYSEGWTSHSSPIGLCVDNGRIVNRNIKNEMDGLVIVEAIGGVRVSDIDLGNLSLLSINRKNVNPRKDKITLLNWGASENATIFQTHLLAYDNQLRVGTNGSYKTSSRRMLALAIKNGEVMHIIFHIKRDVTLYEATKDINRTLKNRGIYVVGILNLDTGGYDILKVYKDSGYAFSDISGTVNNVSDATNLLVYYYAQ